MRFTEIRISLVVLLTLFCTTCFAQSNYKKGFIVKTDGDTLSGFINYQEWYSNPREFSFKLSLDDRKTEKYTVNNSTFLEVPGYATYQLFPVLVSMNEVQFDKLSASTSQPEIEDTLFLKLLVKGKNLSLYSYRDQVKQRFYVLEKGETRPLELGYKLALVNGSVVTFHTYRQQLMKLNEKLIDSSFIRSAIETSAYMQADLVRIINSINGDADSNAILPAVKTKSRRFFLAAGINHSTINYSGETLITSDGVGGNDNRLYRNRRTSAFLPLIAIGTDIYFKREVRKLYVKLEIAAAGLGSEVNSLYKLNMYAVEELSNNYQLSGVVISFRPQLIVNVLNKENVKCYLGAGPSLNYFLPVKNEMYQKTNQQDPPYVDKQQDDFILLKKLFASIIVRAGVTINNKFDISICQSNPVQLNNDITSRTSAKYHSTQLSVAYKFRK